MKSLRTIAALIAILGMSCFAHAGQRGHRARGASKCCDCAPTFQPTGCKPTIIKPCHRNVYNYQRSCAKATGCGDCGGPAFSCCPNAAGNGCGTGCVAGAGNGCGTGCVAGAGNGCVNGAGNYAGNCAAPCGAGCTAGANNCAAPCGNGCATDVNCAPQCGDDTCCATTNQDACGIAQLIYESQTACKSSHRRRALKKLGKNFDCQCNPEIMSAFIYGLNDADRKVRKAAADMIGKQIKKNSCCCTQCTVDALTYALADCDRGVSKRAEKALGGCGFDVVDPNCRKAGRDQGCTSNGCAGNGCAGNGCAVNGGNGNDYSPAAPAVAPAPPTESKAHFPKRNKDEKVRSVSAAKKSLSNLFGLAR